MALTTEQIDKLIGLIGTTEDDSLDCDGCFGQVAEFAEMQLAGKPVTDAMRAVEQHLKHCLCCADEYSALLDGLRALDEAE